MRDFDNGAVRKLQVRRGVVSGGRRGGVLRVTLVFFLTADTRELHCSTSVQPLRLRLSCQDLQYPVSVDLYLYPDWLIGGGEGKWGGSKADARRNLCVSLLNPLGRWGNDAMPALTQMQRSPPRPREERYCGAGERGRGVRSDVEGQELLTNGDLDFIGFSGDNLPKRYVSCAA